MTQIVVPIGAGSIGQAIARRVSAGEKALPCDLSQGNVDPAARSLGDAGFDVTSALVDVASRPSVETLDRKRQARYGDMNRTRIEGVGNGGQSR